MERESKNLRTQRRRNGCKEAASGKYGTLIEAGNYLDDIFSAWRSLGCDLKLFSDLIMGLNLTPANSYGGSKSGAGDPAPKRSFASRLFGYDIFLSFALGPPPRGTLSYASDLTRRLREHDFTVFFSQDEAPPGERLDSTLRTALLHSKMLIVLANHGTLREPRFVRKEVDEFRQCHPRRPVIAINIGGALQDPAVTQSTWDWLGQHGRIWLDESEETVAMGIASDEVVKRLTVASTRAKSNIKWKWLVRCLIAILAALAIGLGVVAKIAVNQARIALSRQLAAQSAAELTNDRERSLLLAIRAIEADRTGQAEDALVNATLAYPHRITLRTTTRPPQALSLSRDGRRAVTASPDGSVQYWSADTGELLGKLSGSQGPLNDLAFSPDGGLILALGKSVLLWDSNTLGALNTDVSRSDDVLEARFSPKGRFIVTRHRNGTASVWESRNGRKVISLRDESGPISTAKFNSTETSVVTGSEGGVARIWSVPSGRVVSELKGHAHRLIGAEFSPDSRLVVTVTGPFPVNAKIEAEETQGVITRGPLIGGRPTGAPPPDDSVRIWDQSSGKVVVIQFPAGFAKGAGFTPAGDVVWVNWNGQLMFYDLEGGRIGNGFDGRLISFSRSGSFFATAELDETLRVRRMENYATIGVFPGAFATFSQDDRRILTANLDGSVFIWRLDDERDSGGLRKSTADFLSSSFSRDGTVVATLDRNGTTRLWDGDVGVELTSTIAPDLLNQRTREAVFGAGTDILLTVDEKGNVLLRNLTTRNTIRLHSSFPVEYAEFSPDASRILTRIQRTSETPRCNLELWSSDTGERFADICLANEEISYARFGSDGSWIQAGTRSGGQIFDGHTGQEIPNFAGADSQVSGSNRQWLATSKDGHTVAIREVGNEQVVAELEAFARSDESVSYLEASFSPDGHFIMTLGEPPRIWDLATRKKVAEIDGTGPIFSPDGRMVASVNVSRNETVARVWEARTGKRLAVTHDGGAVWQSVAFSPDGQRLITTSYYGVVKIWEAATGQPMGGVTTDKRLVSARLSPGARWLALTFESYAGKRDRIYPWERFAPVEDVVRFARTLVARELHSDEAIRYGTN